MPLAETSRRFLTAALVHLAAGGVLLALLAGGPASSPMWDSLLWLLLIGFVQFTTIGFALHLFPSFAHRPLPPGGLERALFPLAEGAVLLGAATLGLARLVPLPPGVFAFAVGLYLLCVIGVLSRFLRAVGTARLALSAPPERSGDFVALPLLLTSWALAPGAGILLLLSTLEPGPGLGFWIAGIHLFVLGHVLLLIVGTSVRLVSRSLQSDLPRVPASLLAGLGIAGAISVTTGMLILSPAPGSALVWFAIPEALFALAFLAALGFLGLRARTPRPLFGLHVSGVVLLLAGGGVGLWMVTRGSYVVLPTHVFLNVLGFVGLTILVMWFGMIAPFQRISHGWTKRMMWALSLSWIVAVLLLATAGTAVSGASTSLYIAGGGLIAGIAVAWTVGTVPVLYPRLNPLPGLTFERLVSLRQRWRDR
jgi:hypothetical protein